MRILDKNGRVQDNKKLFIGAFLALLLVLAIAAVTPILQGRLQSNLDGGGYSITNVGSVWDTNGTQLGTGGSGVTNNQYLPGTPHSTNFTGNGAGLTNLTAGNIANNPQILLDPPHIGPSSNSGNFFLTGQNSAGYKISGSGVVRDIWVQCDLGSIGGLNSNMANIRLEVFTDGGNTTNTTFRTVDVSLADLFGNRFRFTTNGHWAVDRDSFGLNTMDRSTNFIYGSYIKTMMFRLPIYFTNYCLIRLTNASAGTLYTTGYLNPSWEMGGLSDLGNYQSWRLRSKTTFGPWGNNASNFLFSASGPGICVGWLQSFLGTNGGVDLSFLDSISPTFTAPSGVTWETAGGDDMFLSTYAMRGGQSLGYEAGVINRWYGPSFNDTPFAIEAYRWFLNDNIHWTNSVTVYLPDSQLIPAMSATMFYYGP